MNIAGRGAVAPLAAVLLRCAAAAAMLSFATSAARATQIERVVSPGGIEAWVVHEPSPLIAIEFAFSGGAAQDPADKAGLASLATSLLDDGAGDLDGKTFHTRLDSKSIGMSFSAGRDNLRGSLRTLSVNRDEAFNYLRLALTAPRFDPEPVERERTQLLARLQRASTSPNDIANRSWWQTAFPNHPYGRPVSGTPDSIARISVEDMKAYTKHVLARGRLKVAIVGDIKASEVGTLLDKTFGALPAEPELKDVPDVMMQGLGRRIVVPLEVPQAVVTFGTRGIFRSDPDFMAAYVVNHILGNGSSSSRLYQEVREKRGLAYGISDSLSWLDHSAILIGGTATRSAVTGEAIGLIEREMKRLGGDGPTEQEVADAKSSLEGSYALGLDTSGKIASQLVQIQLDKLGIDYIDRRSSLIEAVTLADTKRVAKRLLDESLLETVVGQPQGVSSSE